MKTLKQSKSAPSSFISTSGYLSSQACNEFLVRLYYGPGEDYLVSCIDRAYLDFNRTLHGFRGHADAGGVRRQATDLIKEGFRALLAIKTLTEGKFDRWHRGMCDNLRAHFRRAGYGAFSYGQAQKWVNMTMKYVFVLGEDRLPGYGVALRHAHVPIDNIVLETWHPLGMPKLAVAWSRLDDYKIYSGLQAWTRTKFAPRSPLEAEFWAWIKAREARDDRIGR